MARSNKTLWMVASSLGIVVALAATVGGCALEAASPDLEGDEPLTITDEPLIIGQPVEAPKPPGPGGVQEPDPDPWRPGAQSEKPEDPHATTRRRVTTPSGGNHD